MTQSLSEIPEMASDGEAKVIAIIQARLGSTRLPGKTLERIYDKPLLGHIFERLQACRRIHEIVVATTTNEIDNPIVSLATEWQISVFRGSEDDVLSRFYGAAKQYGADVIVRITADDPFKDPDIIDHSVGLLLEGGYDYCSNTIEPSYPEGIDVEVFQFTALERAFVEAKLKSEREHVTPYIWKNSEEFRVHNFSYHTNLSYFRWTIDYEQDLQFAREVYSCLYSANRIFVMKDILELLGQKPELLKLNQGLIRNEGYLKSVRQDSTI